MYTQLRCTGLADVELTNGEDEHFGMLDGLVNDSEPSIDESMLSCLPATLMC